MTELFFRFLPIAIDAQMIVKFICSFIDCSFFSQFVRSLIFLVRNSLYRLRQVLSLYCHFLFSSLFVCFLSLLFPTPVYSLVSSVVRALSCKPGVESSNLSRGCKTELSFRFLPIAIDAQMIVKFIYSVIDWFVFQSVRSFINILSREFALSS